MGNLWNPYHNPGVPESECFDSPQVEKKITEDICNVVLLSSIFLNVRQWSVLRCYSLLTISPVSLSQVQQRVTPLRCVSWKSIYLWNIYVV